MTWLESLNGFRKYTITNEVFLAQALSPMWFCWQVSVSILKDIYVSTARSMSMLTDAFLFTQKVLRKQRLRSMNHLRVSEKENCRREMSLLAFPWFERDLHALLSIICVRVRRVEGGRACTETEAFWWLGRTKVGVHRSCVALAFLIKSFPYGVDWEKLVVD